jgi:DnaJ like chaperone protein
MLGLAVAGGVGSIVGAGLAFAICLFGFEKAEGDRPTKGFWLRHRSQFLMFACILVSTSLGGATGGIIGILAGFAGGWFAGSILGNELGWSGKSQETDAAIREAYVTVLTSAAESDGVVTTKESNEIIRVTKLLFSAIGYGGDKDVENIYQNAKNLNFSHARIAELIQALPPAVHNPLQFDILRVVFSSGSPPTATQRWLDSIISYGVFEDWSVLQYFSRTSASSFGNARGLALKELDLDPSATVDDIKRAYRAKAHEFHPDKLHNLPQQIRALAEAKMASINNAYQELLGTKSDSGAYFFRNEDGDQSIRRVEPSGFICSCWLCGTANRIPNDANPKSPRCGECHALLGLNFDPHQQ